VSDHSQTSQKTKGILALYKYLDDTCGAMDSIEKNLSEFKGYQVYSPTSYHELIDRAEVKYGPSQVRWFTLVGALSGIAIGFAMPLLMDYDWPIVVGGKTAGIYSLPAYVIFGFELMVLLGAIATIAGMLIMGRIPNPHAHIFHDKLTDDTFGIFVPGVNKESRQAKLLQEHGAIDLIETA
tara:strand:- start:296 stop:838 length:543 start_codon:yes stop_codon:yes gene_type:complete